MVVDVNKTGKKKICGLCGGEGHNKRTCPQNPDRKECKPVPQKKLKREKSASSTTTASSSGSGSGTSSTTRKYTKKQDASLHASSGLPLKLLVGWTANVPRTKNGEWDAFDKEFSGDVDSESADADIFNSNSNSNSTSNSNTKYDEAWRAAPFHDIQPLTVKSNSTKFFGVDELECTFAQPFPKGELDCGNIFTARGLKRGFKDVGFRGTEINIEGSVFHATDDKDYFTVFELFDFMAKVPHSQCEADATVFVGLRLSDDGDHYLVDCKSL